MKTCDLMFGSLGNGLTVFDRAQRQSGDYKTVAHIDPCGVYKLYCVLPADAVSQIKQMARSEGERFAVYWQNVTPARRHHELIEYVLNWNQYTEIGCEAILHINADESLDIYRKFTCENGGYTLPE